MVAVVFKAGDLRHAITFQQRSTILDNDYGGRSVGWTDVKSVKAMIEPLSGRQKFGGDQYSSAVTHLITIRYDPAFADTRVVAAYRILYGTRIFNVEDVQNVEERNRLMVISAIEGMNDG